MFDLSWVPDWMGWVVFASLPGMIASMAISGNVHVFSPWIVVIFSWVFYSLVIWLIRKTIRKFREQSSE